MIEVEKAEHLSSPRFISKNLQKKFIDLESLMPKS